MPKEGTGGEGGGRGARRVIPRNHAILEKSPVKIAVLITVWVLPKAASASYFLIVNG